LSSFSEAGLAAYQSAITDGFAQVLKSRGADPKARGISLIPPTADWPESSLAAMVEWLGQTMPVAYLKVPGGLHEEPKFLNDFSNLLKESDSPVWIFGTSFHFVPLIDHRLLPVLPRGSLAFFTGGTKGKVREVSEAWLIDSLERGFRIPRSHIISEYGMSELNMRLGGNFQSESMLVCGDGSKRTRPLKIGDEGLENEFGTVEKKKYFKFKGANCRYFSERYNNGKLQFSKGVICQNDQLWTVVDKW
jgi:hypothetical protein